MSAPDTDPGTQAASDKKYSQLWWRVMFECATIAMLFLAFWYFDQ